MPEALTARPASTAVLMRGAPEGPQTLMPRRNKAPIFEGGASVFPGCARPRAVPDGHCGRYQHVGVDLACPPLYYVRAS